MAGIRRILCPVDTSEASRHALEHALELARRFDAGVTVLHVYRIPANVQPGVLVWAAVGPRPLWELASEQAGVEMERFLRGFSAEDRARLDVRIEAGDPATDTVDVARDGAYDLLVMGTHGRTGARRFVLGSVAERVIRMAPCPVLTVPSTHAGDSARL